MAENVLFLCSLTADSGSGVRFWNMARCAASAGMNVTLLERRRPGGAALPAGNLVRLATQEKGPLPLCILRSLRAGLRLAKSRPWDAVWALKPLPNSVLPALAAGRRGARLLLDVDDLDFEYYPPGLSRSLVRSCFRRYPARFATVSYHVGPLAEYLRQDAGVRPEALHRVPQGVDFDLFDAPAAPLPPDVRDFTARYRTLVYMASLGITSDAEDALPLLTRLLHAHPDWGLLVLGHGLKQDHFRQIVTEAGAGDRSLFPGYLPHEQVPSVLRACRAGLHYLRPGGANRYRAIMKIREYLAAGLPVAANDSGDATEFAPFLCLAEDLSSLGEKVEEAMSGRADGKGADGAAHVRRAFDWRHLSHGIVSLLRPDRP